MVAAEMTVWGVVLTRLNGNGKEGDSPESVPVVYKDSAYRLITLPVTKLGSS